MTPDRTAMVRRLFAALEEAATGPALSAVERLTVELRKARSDGADLERAWEAFLALLERRGFFVSTPDQVAASLDEIRDVGPGFDLYELAAAMAGYDSAAVDCLGLRESRLFPHLTRFARPCSCGRHPSRRRKESGR